MLTISSATKKNFPGFTLIELLLVVVIIAILIGVSAPRLSRTVDNFELENFVKDIYYLSLYLQGRAISEQRLYALTIDAEKPGFQAACVIEDQLRSLEGSYGKLYRVPAGATVTWEPPDKTVLYFYPDTGTDKATLAFENRHKKQFSLVLEGAEGEIKIK